MAAKYKTNAQNLHPIKHYSFWSETGNVKFALQINYCLLLARRHIWLAKSKEMSPNFDHCLCFLKSRLELETKSGDMEKLEPLAEYIPTNFSATISGYILLSLSFYVNILKLHKLIFLTNRLRCNYL